MNPPNGKQPASKPGDSETRTSPLHSPKTGPEEELSYTQESKLDAERREQFVAMLSHELRNPLAAVLSAIQVVRSEGASRASIEKAAGVVERQSRHMARLLDDLLDVARIANNKFELHEEQLYLDRVVASSLEALAPLLLSQGVKVVSNVADDVVVDGDFARLQQVVTNLLSNAVRHSPAGASVEITVQRDGAEAVVSVKDDGAGIEAELLPKIFDLFVQSGQQLHRPRGGLGVGLSLVKRIMELHGGTVEAQSEGVGKGSSFVARLPLAQRLSAPQQEIALEMSSARIVLVEDQDDCREMLRLLLEHEGHSVTEAADGNAGIEAVTRERPDLALVDIGLPTLSGYDVARAIRKQPELNKVMLVALSGYGAPSDVKRALHAGFDVHLTKPADPARLRQLLRQRRAL